MKLFVLEKQRFLPHSLSPCIYCPVAPVAWGSWYDHVNGWWKKKQTYSNLHYIFYEDLVEVIVFVFLFPMHVCLWPLPVYVTFLKLCSCW